MHVGVMYSGVGGANGADYVAEMLANGFRDLGVRVSMIGRHGQCDSMTEPLPEGADFIVNNSGFNLTPEAVARIRQTSPLFMWTFTDEIGWWQQRIAPVSKLVDIHYSYTTAHPFGDHVRLLPLAADPTWYYPERSGYDDEWRDVDVAMVGAKRAYRVALCEALAKRFPRCFFSWSMVMPVRDVRALYSRTKVVIATVQDCDEDTPGRAWGCPCRTFDVRACRTFELEVERGGLFDAYPSAAMMPAIPNVAEAAVAWGDRIAAALADPAGRAEQARMDYEHTLAYHLYRHRAEQMLADFKARG